jgi:uncharacterized damage-inducible protein DinB
MDISLNHFIDYTEWERKKWQEALRRLGEQVLSLTVGPHGDGRFENIGDMVRHVFTAEKRYVERLTNRPLTDLNAVPNDNLEALFEFGRQSRKEFRRLLETFPATEWDVQREFKILTFVVKASPRKIVMHVLMHEIRHWAQIGTLLRLNGFTDSFHDFLTSPVMGGEWSAGR